jgi:L-Ala-D/L-Glu epimerase
MKIKSVKVRRINIPFKVAFTHSLASRSEVESVIFQLESESGNVGFGECIPRDYVTGETVDGVIGHLTDIVAPVLERREFDDFSAIETWLENFHEIFTSLGEYDLCVKSCVDLALLDLFGKEHGQSVSSYLPPIKSGKVNYSAVLSADSPEKVEKMLKKYRLLMIKQVKLKVGVDHQTDLENVGLVYKILGKRAEVRIDANAEWSLEESKKRLVDFLELGVVSVEQPMPVALKDHYPALMTFLAGRMHISIDESLCSLGDATWFAENKGCSVFNIRISKNGGILNALKITQIAKQHGINCQLGAQVGESSLLSAAGRMVAGIAGDFLFHEGSFGTHLLQNDLTKKPLMFSFFGKGALKSLTKRAGLGVDVDLETLDRITVN